MLPLTVFTPEGVDVIRQGPENRRAFLTHLLTDVDPTTGEVVERFARVLSQRNALLRALEGRWPDAAQRDELEVWTPRLLRACQPTARRRARRPRRRPRAAGLGRLPRARRDRPGGRASPTRGPGAATCSRPWRRARDEERVRGHTTIGPQRDDLAVTLDGRDARRQASQGEQRSLALALRLAGHQLVQARRGVDPLLLLDDVFSELDPLARRAPAAPAAGGPDPRDDGVTPALGA